MVNNPVWLDVEGLDESLISVVAVFGEEENDNFMVEEFQRTIQ